ncbi:4Fe-4S single cluster domain-containing protein [Lachnospiraceae bacterium]|nr:4Fe-4S single cluster domain-containing protein [Lachnospiraceae bacterium]
MPIQINNFMGRLGWNARKYLPNLASNAYLKLQFMTRSKMQKEYCDYFLNSEVVPKPNIVNIETINRCNSTCAFCTANIHAEKRPFMQIDDDLYRSIIDQLADWNYKGHLTLYGNNEPWLDKKIVERHKYAREKLPESFIFMSTNGLILNLEKVKAIQPYVDQLIINNYCLDMKLHKNIQRIYEYVNMHPEEFENIDILIQMRYLKEVLTNRAGSAPNKKATEKVIKETCLLPFTDMWIMPNGKMGLCCCDNFEVTDFGDLTKTPLKEAWGSPQFMEVRRRIAEGRQNYDFCKHCDFIDAGMRMEIVKHILAGNEEAANRQGGHERGIRK